MQASSVDQRESHVTRPQDAQANEYKENMAPEEKS